MQKISKELISKNIIDNMIAALGEMANNATKPDTGIINWKTGKRINAGTQYALLNGMFDYNKPDDDFVVKLQRLVDYFDSKSTPFTWWWLHESPIPQAIKSTLDEFGFSSPGAYSGIALAIDDNNISFELPAAIRVKKITGAEDFQLFINILCETFQMSDTIKEDFAQMLNNYQGDSNLTHYLGYYQNQAVGVLTSYINENTVGLYGGATLPATRKKGVCSSLLKQAINDAKMKDCSIAVAQLMAADMARGAAEQVGFRDYCKFVPFVYGAKTEELEPGAS